MKKINRRSCTTLDCNPVLHRFNPFRILLAVFCHSRLDRESQQALKWSQAKHSGPNTFWSSPAWSEIHPENVVIFSDHSKDLRSESGMTSNLPSGITDRSPWSLARRMQDLPRKSHRPASILIITLLTMSIVTIFTQQLVKSSFVGAYFNRTMINREHAEMLVIGTINLAMVQLTTRMPKQKAGKEEKQDPKTVMWRNYLTRVLPHLNRWQVFDLTEKEDGIDAQVRMCITCENGKINLNDAFDFKKGKFKDEIAVLLRALTTKNDKKQGVVLKKMTKFFKNRNRKLDDITQLLKADALGSSNIFYRPPALPEGTKKAEPNATVFLQDMFTIWPKKLPMQPLLFSDSLCAVFGLRRPRADDAVRIKDKFKQVIDAFKLNWGQNWEANWKFLQIIYDQKPALLKQIKGLLSQEFEPTLYSVLCYAKVGGVVQKLLAVIEKREEKKDDARQKHDKKGKQEGGKQKQPSFEKPFTIKKIYWL